VRALLAAGADPNCADRMGDTALHVAGSINASDLALVLLKAGSDPTLRNAQSATFQTYLSMIRMEKLNEEGRHEREALYAWLLEHGVAIEQRANQLRE
jgi:ankyrin repeat protein